MRQRKKDRDSEMLRRLGEWKQTGGTLPRFVELHAELLRLQMAVKASLTVSGPHLTQEAATARLRQGLPLLGVDDLSLDWTLVQDQFCVIVDILAKYLSPEPGDARGLWDIAADESLLRQAVMDWYQGLPVSSVAEEQCVSEDLLTAAIQSTMQPFLAARSEVLLPLVDQELWRRNCCPVCGGKSDFACLDGERGARWLLCCRCDAEWLFQRLQCPFCGTQDQSSLAYLTDERELYRLYTCDSCRSYIKAVDLRKAEGEVLLTLERVMTADLDRQAVEAGYRPG